MQENLISSFWSVEEMAEQLSVTPRTLARWRSANEGPPVARVGGRVLYPKDAVIVWLRQKTGEEAK